MARFIPDWAGILKWLPNPTTAPKVEIDWKFWEWIRQEIWLREHIHAGSFDDEAYKWKDEAVDVALPTYTEDVLTPTTGSRPTVTQYNSGAMYAFIGDWVVTTWDDKLGCWLWWKNKQDLTYNMAHIVESPPSNIHPQDNVWIFETANWGIAPNPNKYHHWDVKFPGLDRHAAGYSEAGGAVINNLVCHPSKYYPRQVDPRMQTRPVRFKETEKNCYQISKVEFAKEYVTDPSSLGAVFDAWRYGSENYSGDSPPLNIVCKDPYGLKNKGAFPGGQYANHGEGMYSNSPGDGSGGMGENEWSYNQKAASQAYQNHLEKLCDHSAFRVKATAAFTANWRRYNYVDYVSSYQYYSVGEIRYNGSRGNLYIGSGSFAPGSLIICTVADHWTTPELPAEPVHDISAVWATCDVDTISSWDDYPPITDVNQGENESGAEYARDSFESYDWAFDFLLPYIPSYIVEKITDLEINPPNLDPALTASRGKLFEFYDLKNLAGTYRKTYRYSMGRVSPFMRSYEMGTPKHLRDPWRPNTTDQIYVGYPVGLFNAGGKNHWPGARTRDFPPISEFDTNFAAVKKWIDKHKFTVNGDVTAGLHSGWVIHFCNSGTDKISASDGVMQWAAIVRREYDSELGETTIWLDREVNGKQQIGWNPRISERHDAVCLADGTPKYELLARLLYEMHEILEVITLKEVHPVWTSKVVSWGGGNNSQNGMPYEGSPAGARASAWRRAWAQKNYDVVANRGNWTSGATYSAGDIVNYGISTHRCIKSNTATIYNPPGTAEFWSPPCWQENQYSTFGTFGTYGFCSHTISPDGTKSGSCTVAISAAAISGTWSEKLKSCPKKLLLPIARNDIMRSNDSYAYQVQTSGALGASTSFIDIGEEMKTHYNYVTITMDGTWFFLIPETYGDMKMLGPENLPDGTVSYQYAGCAWLANPLSAIWSGKSIVEIHTESDYPDSVWDEDFLNHIDVEKDIPYISKYQ